MDQRGTAAPDPKHRSPNLRAAALALLALLAVLTLASMDLESSRILGSSGGGQRQTNRIETCRSKTHLDALGVSKLPRKMGSLVPVLLF